MKRTIYWVRFRENCDINAIDDICFEFSEATLWYEDNEARFYGTSERLQEFIRALATVGEEVTIK
jgi:hypothetical protein